MQDLLTHINTIYGLSLAFHEKVAKGFLSENFILVGNGTKYFLKKYRFDNKERIEEVHLVKKYFADGGIPVILPIATTDRKTYFFFDNSYYALFPFITDKQLERKSLTDEAIASLGEMLGKIHLLGEKADLPIKERFKPWNKEKALSKIDAIEAELKKKFQLNDFDELALKSIETKKNLIASNVIHYEDFALPSDHLIHGDYLDHNVFFNDRDQVSYVFDFEKTDYSPRAYELFRSMTYSFLGGDTNDEDMAKAKLYLESYARIYPISKEELQRGLKLFYLKSIHAVWVEEEHYLKNNARVDEFLTSDFKRIEYLSQHYKKFEGELMGFLL